MTAAVLHEQSGGSALHERNVAYLRHAATSGEHPRLARLLAEGTQAAADPAGPVDPAERYGDMLARILVGVLGPDGNASRRRGHQP